MSVSSAREFFRAVKRGEAETVRRLLAVDPSLVSARDPEQSTALHHAAWKGHAGLCALLILAGADLEAQSTGEHYGGTPLHAAAHGNQKAVVEMLLGAGADAAAVSCNGRTPLDETAFHNASAAARLLRAALG